MIWDVLSYRFCGLHKEIGKEEKLSEQIRKKIQKGKPLDQIADELEEVPETIRPLYEKIKQEMLQ